MSQIQSARFAPVAPIHILEQLSRDVFGDYHLFLAHHVVEHKARFCNLVGAHQRLQPYSKPLTIIMDNSIVELGGAVDDDMIRAAVMAVAPEPDKMLRVVPCLPDVMGDAMGTRDLSETAYERWNIIGMNTISKSGYMVVTQSATEEEFKHFVDFFFVQNREHFKNITWVGIPRYMLQQGWSSRKWAIRYIRMVAPHLKIHLLGFSDDLVTDFLDSREEGVFGIDSAVPIRYDSPLKPTTTADEIGKRGDWFENGRLTPHNVHNIINVRGWINRDLHNMYNRV